MKVAMSIAFTEYDCQYSAGLFAGEIIAGYQSLVEEFMNLTKNGAGDEIRTHDSVLEKH